MTHLALIEGTTIFTTVTAGRGFDLPSGGRVSPAYDGWDNGTYRLVTIADADAVPEGKRVVSTSAQTVSDAPKWVHVLEDIPPVQLRPIPRRYFFRIARSEFDLKPDGLRTIAGNTAAQAATDAGGDADAADLARDLAWIDFDMASEIRRDNPLFMAMLGPAGLTEIQADDAWRNWQEGLI